MDGAWEGRGLVGALTDGSRGAWEGLPVMDADGHRTAPEAPQSVRIGSQHPVLPPPPVNLGVLVAVVEGHRFVVDVHCVLVGSQQSVGGRALADSRGEGDVVVIDCRTSAHSGSPGVHCPILGSQHRMPLKLESPVVCWPNVAAVMAATKRRRRIMVLLMYAVLFKKNILNHFF
jgi:hypothetical protein